MSIGSASFIAAQNRSLRGIGIVRAHGRVGASILAVGVVDTRRAVGTAVRTVGVRDRIRLARIGAQAAEVLAVGGDDLWGFGGVGVVDARRAVGAAEFAERIGNAVRFQGAAELAKFIRCGIGEKRISAKNT